MVKATLLVKQFILRVILVFWASIIVTLDALSEEEEQVSFIHIPKAGGASVIQGLQQLGLLDEVPAGLPKNREMCFDSGYDPTAFNVAFFRSPREHVRSQFLECKYDVARIREGHTAFPLNCDDSHGFKIWVQYFTGSKRRKSSKRQVPLSKVCYNPRSMQVRQMASPCKETPHLQYFPFTNQTLSSALDNLHKLDHIGIVEVFPASWCLLLSKLRQSIPNFCYDPNQSISVPHNDHGIPRELHVSAAVWKEVDYLTKLDRVLYKAALVRFLTEFQRHQESSEHRFHTSLLDVPSLSQHIGYLIPLNKTSNHDIANLIAQLEFPKPPPQNNY